MNSLADLVKPHAVYAELRRSGFDPGPEGSFRLDRAWPYRRFPLVALFRVESNDVPQAWWTLASTSSTPLPRSVRKHLRRGRAIALPSLDAVVLPFPTDPELPRAEEMLSPAHLAGRLAELVGGDAATDISTVQRISYKPMRRLVIGCETGPTPDGNRSYIGKAFRAGEDEQSWSAASALERALADREDPDVFRVACPRGRVADWRMLLWSRSPGRTFLGLAESNEAVVLARRIGAALAALQRSGVGWTRRHTVAEELAVVDRWCKAARRAFPELVRNLDRANLALAASARRSDESELVPSHRDFFDKQVLIDDGRITLLDFDTACRAEKELDPGNFAAHLRLRRMQGLDVPWRHLRASLLEGYACVSGCLDETRLRFYEATALTRLACVYAFRGHWRQLSFALMDEALESLHDGRPTYAH